VRYASGSHIPIHETEVALMAQKITLTHAFGALSGAQRTWVEASLLDFARFGAHHPYMKRVTLLSDARSVARYRVEETIKVLGVLPQHPTYKVECWREEAHVCWHSNVQGVLGLEFRWTLPETNHDAPIVEQVSLDGPWPIPGVFLRIMTPAHVQTMQAMRAALPPP
jgi:hypothetical protein